MPEHIRPTKKQLELLEFIEQFIAEHGYSPSYREIMVGCNYTSVATVALHVHSLIARGHLVKRGRSARSLELTAMKLQDIVVEKEIAETDSKWLVREIDTRFNLAETNVPTQKQLDELFVLVGALKVLQLHDAANSFMPRLKELRNKITEK
jgi:SOS-response transcriptional repressor LexA